MPHRTNSEKIETKEKELLRQGLLDAHLSDRFQKEVGDLLLPGAIIVFETYQALATKTAIVEYRLLYAEPLLEKSRFRKWKIELAFLE